MLIISVKEGENIERALKRYKKKYNNTKVVRQLRARRYFNKPSVVNREMRLKAQYIEDTYGHDA
jgi:small subunit ribosomal protein S21